MSTTAIAPNKTRRKRTPRSVKSTAHFLKRLRERFRIVGTFSMVGFLNHSIRDQRDHVVRYIGPQPASEMWLACIEGKYMIVIYVASRQQVVTCLPVTKTFRAMQLRDEVRSSGGLLSIRGQQI